VAKAAGVEGSGNVQNGSQISQIAPFGLLVEQGLHCNSRRWRKFMLYSGEFIRFDYQHRAFGHDQCVNRDIASDEDFASDSTVLTINFSAIIAHQVIEPIRCYEIADLFVYFSHHALQIRFVMLAMTAKKTNLTWLENAGDIIALLKQKTTSGVDYYCASNFTVS
jgi:hypothetical protein